MRRVGRNVGSEDREGGQGVSRNAPTRSGGDAALLTVSRTVGMRVRGERRGEGRAVRCDAVSGDGDWDDDGRRMVDAAGRSEPGFRVS